MRVMHNVIMFEINTNMHDILILQATCFIVLLQLLSSELVTLIMHYKATKLAVYTLLLALKIKCQHSYYLSLESKI